MSTGKPGPARTLEFTSVCHGNVGGASVYFAESFKVSLTGRSLSESMLCVESKVHIVSAHCKSPRSAMDPPGPRCHKPEKRMWGIWEFPGKMLEDGKGEGNSTTKSDPYRGAKSPSVTRPVFVRA